MGMKGREGKEKNGKGWVWVWIGRMFREHRIK